LQRARALLLEITGHGHAGGDGISGPDRAQYIADLISVAAIGARTTESQTHREDGERSVHAGGLEEFHGRQLQVAMNAMGATRITHSFLGINEEGVTSIVRTNGNPNSARGAARGPGDDELRRGEHQRGGGEAWHRKTAAGIDGDCSHANSEKKFAKQEDVWHSVIDTLAGRSR